MVHCAASLLAIVLASTLNFFRPLPQTVYEKPVLVRSADGTKDIIQLLAKQGDYEVRQQPRSKRLKMVVPEIILLNGWIYLTGDRPSVVVDNILIAQAEGSKMLVQEVEDGRRWFVVMLEAGPNKYGKVSVDDDSPAPDSALVPEGQFVEVIKEANQPVQIIQAKTHAQEPAVTSLIDQVKAKRIEHLVP